VSADPAPGVSVGQALAELRRSLGAIDWPQGYEVAYGGQADLMGEASQSLVRVLGFALFFALVILVVQFNRVRVPFVILGTVPFSLAGILILLVATGIPMGSTVVIGMLVVVAAHVMEGVLVLAYAEEIRARDGLAPAAAVVHAATIRFRPRLMTALGVLIGMSPIALNLEEGGDMLQPMAVAAQGGLVMGVFVALYLVPVLYTLVTRGPARSERVGRLSEDPVAQPKESHEDDRSL
jgi:multidrug efflux pump subunit AcrB